MGLDDPPAQPVALEGQRLGAGPRPKAGAWAALALLILLALPLHLCLPLWDDVYYYGLFARTILHGGVLERDLNFFAKPPAMVWCLAALTGPTGWRPEVIRLADFAIVLGCIGLLAHWLGRLGMTQAAKVWAAFVLLLYYVSTTDWNHCQPDVWMLLPALLALHLRRRQVAALIRGDDSLRRLSGRAVLEGWCWGCACLFKPFVVVPGLACWAVSVTLVRRRGGRFWPLAADLLGLLAGGLMAGGVWVAWLWWGGGWSAFWDDFRVWGPGYYTTVGSTLKHRTLYLVTQFFPWGLVNVVAVPAAVLSILQATTGKRASAEYAAFEPTACQALLGACYLGWLVQANYIQFQIDYHLVPALLLALAVVAGQVYLSVRLVVVAGRSWVLIGRPPGWLSMRPAVAGVLVAVLAAVVLAFHPLMRPDRLALWGRCFQEGSSPALRDALALESHQSCWLMLWKGQEDSSHRGRPVNLGGFWNSETPSWRDLERVAQFLRSHQVKDYEVTCYSTHTTNLYLDLDLRPSTRILFVNDIIWMYPDHRERIWRELNASRQRFVVTDLAEALCDRDRGLAQQPKQPLALPPIFPKELKSGFPWTEPVVFRAGPYLVHRVTHHPIPPLAVWHE